MRNVEKPGVRPDQVELPVPECLHAMGGEFREVMKNSKLVFTTTAFDGPDGPKLRNLNTVIFEAQGSKTKVTLVAVVEYAAPEMAMALGGMEQGWSESLDKLGELLAKE